MTYFKITVALVSLYATKAYLKSQGHLKVKVKATLYQGQMKENEFSVYLQMFLWSMYYVGGMPSTEKHSCSNSSFKLILSKFGLPLYKGPL